MAGRAAIAPIMDIPRAGSTAKIARINGKLKTIPNEPFLD
jgi:hypothetical protein